MYILETILLFYRPYYKVTLIFCFCAIITLLLSLLICFAGKKLFQKSQINKKTSYRIPVYNLIALFHIAEIPNYFFCLILLPIVNIIIIMFIGFKLSVLFKVDKKYKYGLIFLPFVFIPMLGNSKYMYKKELEEENDSVSEEFYSVLSQEKLDELNKQTVVEDKIESRFQGTTKKYEEVEPFKAQRVKVNKELAFSDALAPKPVERIDPIKAKDIFETENKFIEEDEVLEIVEL